MASHVTPLAEEKFVSLTTFKKNGDGVPGPMWIAGDGDRLAIWTPADSWKVKRARRDPRVTLVPCTRSGKVDDGAKAVEGTAEIVSDPAVVSRVEAALKKKYGVMYSVVTLMEKIIARGTKPRVVLRIAVT
jgi:uncharacterized protein